MSKDKPFKLVSCCGDNCNRDIKLFGAESVSIAEVVSAIESRGWSVNTNSYLVGLDRLWGLTCPTCSEDYFADMDEYGNDEEY